MAISRGDVFPTFALLVTSAAWGSSFFLLKGLLRDLDTLDVIAWRYGLGALVGALFFAPRLFRANLRTWRRGTILGAWYVVSMMLQVFALRTTDASVSGFITAMYVVFTPLVMLLVFRQAITQATVFAVAFAVIGLAFLSLQGLSMGLGESLTLLSALGFAIHIVLLGHWSPREDALTLSAIQLISMGVFGVIAALPGGISMPSTGQSWAELSYLVLIPGVGGMVIQTWAQARMPASKAAVIMVGEPVWAALFAVLLGGEYLTWRLVLGGILILCGMLVSELGNLSPLSRLSKRRKQPIPEDGFPPTASPPRTPS
ncbi:MAG: DMT family transporter [Actinomycetaceae bacterium]|nr:DMT family transporter [Actinomycetaceae bacterium]